MKLVLAVTGAAALVAGAAVLHLAAGLIVLGVVCVTAAYLMAYLEAR